MAKSAILIAQIREALPRLVSATNGTPFGGQAKLLVSRFETLVSTVDFTAVPEGEGFEPSPEDKEAARSAAGYGQINRVLGITD